MTEEEREQIMFDIQVKCLEEDLGRTLSEEEKFEMKLDDEYERRFGRRLTFHEPGYEQRSHLEVLKECLRTGKPYDDGAVYEPGCVY